MTWLRSLIEPVPSENRHLLDERWRGLPAELRVEQQALGRYLSHCGYVLGPSYCSFGCTHCYLPKNANRAPLPSFDEMKRQIDANRRLLGHAGHLQITGGDVVDAYWRAGRPEELIRVLQYTSEVGLVPMLMTHGQGLLDHPEWFEEMVVSAHLRNVALHVDLTQAGRPGFPRRELRSEADLHPLRQQFVDLVLAVRKKTGKPVTAAHTVTVTESNLDSVGEIVGWLIAEPRRLEAFSMLSLQPEADIGRTRKSNRPATPEAVWREVCRALGKESLAEDNLYFGDPACSRMTTIGVLGSGQILDALPGDPRSLELRNRINGVFGGVGGRGADRIGDALRRAALVVRHPSVVADILRYAHHVVRREGRGWGELLTASVTGRLSWLNIVQHNFMSASEVRAGGPEVQRRLDACGFRGAVEREDGWHAVPMCAVNTDEREQIYAEAIEASLEAVEKIPNAASAVGSADDEMGAVVELES